MGIEAGGRFTASDWHAAIAGSLNLGFLKGNKGMEFEREFLLSAEPMRIGFILLIKRTADGVDNPLVKLFRWHNIIEFISPDEEFNAASLWKCIGYAGLYQEKLSGKIPADEITVTVFGDTMPPELLKTLEGDMKVEIPVPGIYVIENGTLPAIRLVILSELEDGVFGPLKLLSESPADGDVRQFLIEAKAACADEDLKEDVMAVLNISAARNRSLFEKLKEEEAMCDALREIMKDELAKERKEGVNEGFTKGRTLGKKEGKNEGQKALVNVIRSMKEGVSESEILSEGYELNTLSLAKSVM